jgi:hypothetical protein
MSASQNGLLDCAEAAEMAPGRHTNGRKKYRKRTQPQLLSRQDLDRRRNAVQAFDRLVRDITGDLAGDTEISAIERHLIEAFAGASITLDNLNAKVLLGQEINLAEYAQTVSAMVRVASRLGLQRRCKDISPQEALDQYLAQKHAASDEVAA